MAVGGSFLPAAAPFSAFDRIRSTGTCGAQQNPRGTPCGSEVRHGVTSGISGERSVRKTGIGGEVRHGVTSGVTCETSSNKHVTPHLHREYDMTSCDAWA